MDGDKTKIRLSILYQKEKTETRKYLFVAIFLKRFAKSDLYVKIAIINLLWGKQMERSLKEIIFRVIILLTGLTIAHLGVTLFLLADLGADPFNVLVQGIFRTIRHITGWEAVTHGYTHVAICFLIILVLLIVDRSYIKIGTVLCMVCGGPIIDFFTKLLSFLFAQERALWFKLIVLAIGCVILAFGMTIVIKSDAGTGPNDLVALVISEKSHVKFSIVRVIVDVAFVVVGYVAGGSFGIGTVVCAGLVGPVAGFFLPKSEKIVRYILGKCMHT